MKQSLIQARNAANRILYKHLLKRIFFRMDPEKIHERMTRLGKLLGSNFFTRNALALGFSYKNKKLEQTIAGIHFPNPAGLAAGFDKNAELLGILPAVGFGFIEVGSITGEPCEGNPKPRLWRLPKSRSLAVYYGLKNKGCEAIAKKLKKTKCAVPFGVSIAKTNCKETVSLGKGIADYVKAYRTLKNFGNYVTLNISCPNAFGGQPFTDAKKLDALLNEIDKIKNEKPIFLKLSADLSPDEIDAIIAVSRAHKIPGFICTNLTKNRNNKKLIEKDVPEKGGLSGKAVEELSNKLIAHIYQKTNRQTPGEFVIIGCGGIFSAEDAYKKIKLGASLVQLITGMIYGGPQLISDINRGMVKLLEKDGYTTVGEAVGKNED